MQTLTVEITDDNAIKVLQYLEEKQHIKILSMPHFNSPVFHGSPLTESQFTEWISERENSKTLSLTEVKNEWAKKRESLLKHDK